MKKLLLANILFVILSSHAFSQNQNLVLGYYDSLKRELTIHKEDTARVLLLAELAFGSFMLDYNACMAYCREGLELAEKTHFKRGEVRVLCAMSGGLSIRGDVPEAMKLVFRGLEVAEENHFPFETALCLVQISANYWFLNDFPQSVSYGKQAKQVYETIQEDKNPGYHFRNYLNINIGMPYNDMNQLDSAMVYFLDIYKDTADHLFEPVALSMLGDVQFKLGNHQQAFEYLYESIRKCEEAGDYYTNADACKILARCFVHLKQVDSAIFYAKKGLANAQVIDYKVGVLDNCKILASQYETKDISQSHYYLKMFIALNNELFGAKKVQDLQKTLSEDQERQRQSDVKRVAYENNLKQYGFLAGLGGYDVGCSFSLPKQPSEAESQHLTGTAKRKSPKYFTGIKIYTIPAHPI